MLVWNREMLLNYKYTNCNKKRKMLLNYAIKKKLLNAIRIMFLR